MLFAFVGMPGAGKSLAIDAMKAQGVPVVHLRLVVEDECKKRGLPLDNKNLRSVASDLRVTYGRDVVVKRASGLIDAAYNNGHMVIDSLKSPEELNEAYEEHEELLKIMGSIDPQMQVQPLADPFIWIRDSFAWLDENLDLFIRPKAGTDSKQGLLTAKE